MTKFELCYEIRDTKEYIIPELFSNKVPVEEYPNGFKGKSEILYFEYWYKFMPKGIVSRLIVRMHNYIYKKIQWKSGVVLNNENTYAENKELRDERKLKIRIYGDYKKELLAIIRKEVTIIHDSFEKLRVNEMVPCICSECKENCEPFFYLPI